MSRALFFAILAAATPAAAVTGYFAELPDLPLPPSFSESRAAASFEGAHGRVLVAEAVGGQTISAARDFYAACLPALGWAWSPAAGEGMEFVRGRERLSLSFSA